MGYAHRDCEGPRRPSPPSPRLRSHSGSHSGRRLLGGAPDAHRAAGATPGAGGGRRCRSARPGSPRTLWFSLHRRLSSPAGGGDVVLRGLGGPCHYGLASWAYDPGDRRFAGAAWHRRRRVLRGSARRPPLRRRARRLDRDHRRRPGGAGRVAAEGPGEHPVRVGRGRRSAGPGGCPGLRAVLVAPPRREGEGRRLLVLRGLRPLRDLLVLPPGRPRVGDALQPREAAALPRGGDGLGEPGAGGGPGAGPAGCLTL